VLPPEPVATIDCVLPGGLERPIVDTIFYLSHFYRTEELPLRSSLFWVAYTGVQIVAAFLVFGIKHLRSTYGVGVWQWLFILEVSLAVWQP
jgi:hypothetical protein